jgi:hypothetical protein
MEISPPFTKEYRFTSPHTAISCDVEYDKESECYVAKGSGFIGTGNTEEEAAIMCFTVWVTGRRAWYDSETR